MALVFLTLFLAPVLSSGLTDTWGWTGASQKKDIPGLHPQKAPETGDHSGSESVKAVVENAKSGWNAGVTNPLNQWAHGIKDKVDGVHKHVSDEATKVAKSVEKAAKPVVKRVEAEIAKRVHPAAAPTKTTSQHSDAGKLLNAHKVTVSAGQAQHLAKKAGTSNAEAMRALQTLAQLSSDNMRDDDEEFKKIMTSAFDSTFEDEKWREDPYKQDEIERLPIRNLPTDAMVDAMWAMKAPSDDKIMQVWNDLQSRGLSAKEREFTTNEVNAWISMVMQRRRAVRKEAMMHPEQPPTFSFMKHGKQVTGSLQNSQMDMGKGQDNLPTVDQLSHLPSDEMVTKMWHMENPSNAAMRQVWKEMLAPTVTVQEKELVSREVQDWIKLNMNKRKARKFRQQVLDGPK